MCPPGGGRVAVVRAVTGMRGVGKTQLAAAHARDRLAEHWRLIAWVDAETREGLLAGLAETASVLGLSAKDAPTAGKLVRRRLETDGDRCLLVLDNATDPSLVEQFLPAIGQAQVIITSNHHAMANLGTAVTVDVYSPEQATDFLATRTGYPHQPEAAALADELGYLPLALAQAAAVIASQRISYPTYLARLRKQPVRQLLGPVAAGQYRHGTAAAILLALDAAGTADPSGVSTAVMDLLAVLSPAGVPRDLLRAAGEQGLLTDTKLTTDLVDEALARLGEASLLTLSLDGTTVAAHRLVMRVIRDMQAETGLLGRVCDHAARLLLRQNETLPEVQADRAAARNLTSQIQALQQSGAACTAEGDLDGRMLTLKANAVYLLSELGEGPALAVSLGEEVAAARERILGPDHPDTLTSRNNLAIGYRAAGRTAEAIEMDEQTLATFERILGPDHPDTLTSRNNLALGYRAAGRTAEAIALDEQTLAARERILGPDHPDTLGSRGNLAGGYHAAGRTAEAIEMDEQTLATFERILGPDHPETLRSRGNLALGYRAAGRTAEAIEMDEQTLAARERILGPDHPDTLISRSNLALGYRAAGRTAEAIEMDEQTLAARERILGPDHPDTLTSRSNLAIGYHVAGRTAEAIEMDEQTLAARERILGPDHPETLRSRSNLAIGYHVAGRTAEAIALDEQTLAARERILGPDHPDTLTSRSNLAIGYRAAGRTADSARIERARKRRDV
jgi:tetratricopeptide (TPR) repeat protein